MSIIPQLGKKKKTRAKDSSFLFPWPYLDPKTFHKMAMVFLVVMYGCESWTVKKAER